MPARRARSKERTPFLNLRKGDEVSITVVKPPDFSRDPLQWASGDVYVCDVEVDGEGEHAWVIHCEHGEADLVAELEPREGDRLRLWKDSCDPPEHEDGREVLIVHAERTDDEPPARPARARGAASSRRPPARAPRAPAKARTAQEAPQVPHPPAVDGVEVLARLPAVAHELTTLAVDALSHVPTGKKGQDETAAAALAVAGIQLWARLGYPQTPGELARERAGDVDPEGDTPPEDDIPF